MKNFIKTLLLTISLLLPASFVLADASKVPPDNSSKELKQIKSLAGRWTSVTSMFGKKNQRIYTEYKVISGGSAVLETIFPGTPYEMVSVYYDDKGKLAMTHYCMMRNRPILKLINSTDDSITLDVKKIEGLKSKDDHSMGKVVLNFKNKNQMSQTCYARGKKPHEPMTFEYTRVK